MDEVIWLIFGGLIGGLLVFILLGSRGGYQYKSSYSYPYVYEDKSNVVASNTEKWEWIDYKGRKRYILVTREVH